jgi:hypothetical protein
LRIKLLCSIAVLAAAFFAAAPAHAAMTPVDIELVLLVDVGSTINPAEFDLQQQGYVQAFQSDPIIRAIQAGPYHRIAATLIYWAGPTQQFQAVDWMLLKDSATAGAFASAIGAAPRPFDGLTDPASAIVFSYPQFSENAFDGNRWIIDVSGDAPQNAGYPVTIARDLALAAGTDQINGLCLLWDDPDLRTWYTANVIGGPNAFSLPVYEYADFARGIQDKIVREIAPVPEPMTVAGLALGLGALTRYLRLRRA